MLSRLRPLEKVRRRPSEVFRKAARSPRSSSLAQSADSALITVFVLSISLPLAGLLFGFDRSFVLEENRILAARPELKPARKALGAFPAKFEAYWNDQFGFRKRLIYWLALVKVFGLGVTATPDVTLGQGGWLYLASDAARASFRAARPFTPRQLEDYQRIIEARRDWLAERGIPYLLVIPPNKDTIYPEFMPPAYTRVHSRSRLDQLVHYMRSHSTVPILDVRDDLRQARQRERVYDVTDSHWNQAGGYVAYAQIMQALKAWFPRARAIPRSEFLEIAENGPGGDLARMLGIADRMPEDRVTLVPRNGWRFSETNEVFPITARSAHPELTMATECAGAELPRAVLFRDSFAAQLIPFLAEHFERMLCVWDGAFDRAIIEHERPGIVIQEVVERLLERALPIDK